MKQVYVVVTEEYYGGDLKIKVFLDIEKAEEYKKEIENKNLDVVILIKELN
jgi:hypothetical protein